MGASRKGVALDPESVGLDGLLGEAGDLVVISDRDGVYVYCSNAETIGLTDEDILGQTLEDLLEPENAEPLRAQTEEVFRTGKASNRLVRLYQNGREWLSRRYAYPIRGRGGAIDYVGHIHSQLRCSAEAAPPGAGEEPADLWAAVGAAPETYLPCGVFELDREGCLTHLDEEGRRLLERGGEDLAPGLDCFDLVAEADRQAAREAFRAGLQGLCRWLRLGLLRGREPFPAWLEVGPRLAGGRVCGLRGRFFDLTPCREREARLARREHQAASRLLGAGLAHELNNAMCGVVGYLELVRRVVPPTPPATRYLGQLHHGVQRVLGVLRDLTSMSECGFRHAAAQSLPEAIEESWQAVCRDEEAAEVDFAQDLRSRDPVRIGGAHLLTILRQLFANAVHSMLGGRRRRLAVRTDRHGDCVLLRISDTGCGIAPADLCRITEPFFSRTWDRAEKGSPLARVRGLGLGLTICQNLVEGAGGSLRVESTLDKGTTVTVSLPVASPD